jgi:hypothetical protein
VYWAQYQQQAVQQTAEGAVLHNFERARCMGSFAERMGAASLRDAISTALFQGWNVSTGWDHGMGARREWCVPIIWSDREQEAWALRPYCNAERTTPEQDARAVRAMLDDMGVPIRRVVYSKGDVGETGKGTAAAGSINSVLTTARYEDGRPILGFDIHLPAKGPGSVERGCELMNQGLASGALRLDVGAEALAVAIENWTGGEGHKDACDAFRYVVRDILEAWLMAVPGMSGFSSG